MTTTKALAQQLNSFMPAAFDTTSELYRLLFADDFTTKPSISVGHYFPPMYAQPRDYDGEGGGAVIESMKKFNDFLEEYTSTINVDNMVGSHLDKVVRFFSGLERIFTEPDLVFRNRYKAIIERRFNKSWGTVRALRDVLSYFYDAEDIFIAESYPHADLLTNGNFDSGLSGWTVGGTATITINTEDRTDGVALVIDSSVSPATLSQSVFCQPGQHALVAFFSRNEEDEGRVVIVIADAAGRIYNQATNTWSSENTETGTYSTVGSDAGDVGMVAVSFVLESTTTLTIAIHTVSGKSCILDSVRFGRVDYPSMLVVLMSRFEVFYNEIHTYDETIAHNGYEAIYKNVDIDSMIEKIRPAGVYTEVQLKPFTTIV